MVEVEELCQTIKRVLARLGKSGAPFDRTRFETVLDDVKRRYVLLSVGKDQPGEPAHRIAQVDVVEGKAVIVINKMFPTINEYLRDAGIPNDQITLINNGTQASSAVAN